MPRNARRLELPGAQTALNNISGVGGAAGVDLFGGWEAGGTSGSIITIDSTGTLDMNDFAVSPDGSKVAFFYDDGTDVFLKVHDTDAAFGDAGTRAKIQDSVASADNDSRFGGICWTDDLMILVLIGDATSTNDPELLTYAVNVSTNALTFKDSDNLAGNGIANTTILKNKRFNTDRAICQYFNGFTSSQNDLVVIGITVNVTTGVITLDASETDMEVTDDILAQRTHLCSDGAGLACSSMANASANDNEFAMISDGGTSTSKGTTVALGAAADDDVIIGIGGGAICGYLEASEENVCLGDYTSTTINNIDLAGKSGVQKPTAGGYTDFSHIGSSGDFELFVAPMNDFTSTRGNTRSTARIISTKAGTSDVVAYMDVHADVALNFTAGDIQAISLTALILAVDDGDIKAVRMDQA